MKDLNQHKSQDRGNGNRFNPSDAKIGDAQHGQTDVKKAAKRGRPPGATR